MAILGLGTDIVEIARIEAVRNVENIRRLLSFNWWRRAIGELINALCGDVSNRIKYTRRGA